MILIPKHRKGDWWNGMTLTFKTPNGSLMNLQGDTFKADFISPLSRNSISKVIFSFSTADNTMLVNNGKILFTGRNMNVIPVKYIAVLQRINSLGQVKTITNISWEIWI